MHDLLWLSKFPLRASTDGVKLKKKPKCFDNFLPIGDKLLVKINYSSNDITFMFSLASCYVPVCASMFFVTGFNGTTHFNCKCVKRLVMRKLVIT